MAQGRIIEGQKYFTTNLTNGSTSTKIGIYYCYQVYINGSISSYYTTSKSSGQISVGTQILRASFSGDILWTGNVDSFEYFNVKVSQSTVGGGTGGSLTGGGNYVSGTTANVKATPKSGYVLTAMTGESIDPPTTGSVTHSFSVGADTTVSATFNKYYKVKYDANGGVGNAVEQSPCLYGTNYQYVQNPFSRANYSFAGWGKTKTATTLFQPNSSFSNLSSTAGATVTMYAIWAQYKITYNSNGGTSVPETVGGMNQSVRLANAPSREGYRFAGWTIGGNTYNAGGNYTITGNITAVAQWTRANFDITVTNPDTSIAVLSLWNGDTRVADEINGVLTYEALYEGKTYRIGCVLSGNLYVALGVPVGNSYSLELTPSEGESIAKTFAYDERRLYEIVASEGGEELTHGSISFSRDPDSEGKWVQEQVVATVTPTNGWRFLSYTIINSDSGVAVANGTRPTFNITPSFNVLVQIVFEAIDYESSVAIDDASVGAGSVSAAYGDDLPIPSTLPYGTEVTFSATPNEGYGFAGWYRDGILLSEESNYTHTIDADSNIVAKFSVHVQVEIDYQHNGQGEEPGHDSSLFVDGLSTPSSFYVTLGESFSYELNAGSWFFNCWKTDDGNVILPYEQSGEITPTEPISLVILVTSVQVKNYLSVIVMVKTGDGAAISDYTPILKDTENPVITAELSASNAPSHSGPGLQGADPEEEYKYYFEFEGTKYVSAHAADSVEYNGDDKSFGFFAVKNETSGEWSVLSKSQDYVLFLNKNVKIYACYGSLSEVEFKLDYTSGSNRTMGLFAIGETSNEGSSDGSVSEEVMQLQSVNISVMEKNGYVFAGWYETKDAMGSPIYDLKSVSVRVIGEKTLYAHFVKNRHAVYEWEGSNENKMMEWRSRLFVSPRPFNPSACRVDTDGYPLQELSVEMFSSPDTSPTAAMTLSNVASQVARRLPCVRPERYMQIVVKNDHEVDRVVVGTSMGGLAV